MTTLPEFQALGTLEFVSTACPVCGAQHIVGELRKTYLGHQMCFQKCGECRTLYANPRLSVESLRRLYSSADFFEGGEKNYNYYSFLAEERPLRRTARSRVGRIKAVAPGNRLLEVASAAGFFLKEAADAGFQVQGVEFSKPMAQYAEKRWNVRVIPESVELVDLPAASFDVVASWGVMTIIRDPVSFAAKVATTLKSGGIWAFNTYYTESLWGRLFGNNWYILVPNTSQIHSDSTLQALVRGQGFELVRRRRDCPYASLGRIVFVLSSHIPGRIGEIVGTWSRHAGSLCVRVPAPDVYEYIWRKR